MSVFNPSHVSARLFIATGIFHPESGGPATYLHEILPALQTRAWQVRLLTYGDAQSNAGDYPYAVQRVPRRLLPLRLLHYAALARAQLAWADVVYMHTLDLPLWGPSRAPRLVKIVGDAAWERCIRKGWVAPTTDIDAFQTTNDGGIVGQQQQSRSRQAQAMDGVIVPSDYLKRMVMGWGVPEAHIHTIYNAMPPLRPTMTVSSQAEARAQLGLPDAPIVFTAARLTAWKGIDHLINALKQVPDVRLIVAGDGEQRAYLASLAQASAINGRVTFLGRVPRATVYQYMQAADYVALYSGYEGLPHTLLESLRVGTPVIASDKGGNPEVVQHGVNGLLVPYVDVDALAQTLQTAFSGDTRQHLATHTSTGLDRFDFATMVEQTHTVLKRYAQHHAR